MQIGLDGILQLGRVQGWKWNAVAAEMERGRVDVSQHVIFSSPIPNGQRVGGIEHGAMKIQPPRLAREVEHLAIDVFCHHLELSHVLLSQNRATQGQAADGVALLLEL